MPITYGFHSRAAHIGDDKNNHNNKKYVEKGQERLEEKKPDDTSTTHLHGTNDRRRRCHWHCLR